MNVIYNPCENKFLKIGDYIKKSTIKKEILILLNLFIFFFPTCLAPPVQQSDPHPAAFFINYFKENSEARMKFTIKQMSLIVATLGIVSFVLGIIAENKKPAAGIPLTKDGVVICKYPSDLSVGLGIASVVFLLACTAAGYYSLVYPYKGKSIPQGKLFQNSTLLVFLNIAVATTGLALAMLLWPTITEHLHHSKNVHHNLETTCPTAKTGLLGGGAFLSLDSCLFWLVALMLADNARDDYFEGGSGVKDDAGEEEGVKGTV